MNKIRNGRVYPNLSNVNYAQVYIYIVCMKKIEVGSY